MTDHQTAGFPSSQQLVTSQNYNGSHTLDFTGDKNDVTTNAWTMAAVSSEFHLNQVDSFRFRTSLIEIVEELKLRRKNEAENEERTQMLIKEKHELERKIDVDANRIKNLQDENSKGLTETKRKFEEKMRVLEEKARQDSVQKESLEKEMEAMKDELRRLQLSKYTMEKLLRDQEQKVQIQSDSTQQHLQQLSAVEHKLQTFSSYCTKLVDSQQRLDRQVKEAIQLNQTLTYVNEHQKCLIGRDQEVIASLEARLLEANKKVQDKPTVCSDSELRLDMARITQQLEGISHGQDHTAAGRGECSDSEQRLDMARITQQLEGISHGQDHTAAGRGECSDSELRLDIAMPDTTAAGRGECSDSELRLDMARITQQLEGIRHGQDHTAAGRGECSDSELRLDMARITQQLEGVSVLILNLRLDMARITQQLEGIRHGQDHTAAGRGECSDSELRLDMARITQQLEGVSGSDSELRLDMARITQQLEGVSGSDSELRLDMARITQQLEGIRHGQDHTAAGRGECSDSELRLDMARITQQLEGVSGSDSELRLDMARITQQLEGIRHGQNHTAAGRGECSDSELRLDMARITQQLEGVSGSDSELRLDMARITQQLEGQTTKVDILEGELEEQKSRCNSLI
ncbi:myosin heavy chain, cardiac muscle isoform-like [Argopecten irradians]|uniref:myosin heavy chain, cardiac muscle isoform-like n=1 Tax=Argopecten irradians TaxID=31199 RepID=UPI0037225788